MARYLYIGQDEDFETEGLFFTILSFADEKLGERFHALLEGFRTPEFNLEIDVILHQLSHPVAARTFPSDFVCDEQSAALIAAVGPECVETHEILLNLPALTFGSIKNGFVYKSNDDNLLPIE
jgi:hypothetical protein